MRLRQAKHTPVAYELACGPDPRLGPSLVAVVPLYRAPGGFVNKPQPDSNETYTTLIQQTKIIPEPQHGPYPGFDCMTHHRNLRPSTTNIIGNQTSHAQHKILFLQATHHVASKRI